MGRQQLVTEEARREYYAVSSPIYAKCSSQKLSETAKDRLINSHESVAPSYERYVDCKKKLDLLEFAILNIEDAIFMISREVTRRTGDFTDENRAHNVGRR
jgi:hypothetical protein